LVRCSILWIRYNWPDEISLILIDLQVIIENLQLLFFFYDNLFSYAFQPLPFQDRLFNEGVHVEDDSDNEDGESTFVNRNPYRTPEPHPALQTAFDLGMIGLEKLKEKPDLLDGGYRHYRRCPVKEHLSEFCRCVFSLLCSLHSVCCCMC